MTTQPIRSFETPRPTPRFKFKFDLDPAGGLISTPQFVLAADEADAEDRLAERMGPVPFEVTGKPMKVGVL